MARGEKLEPQLAGLDNLVTQAWAYAPGPGLPEADRREARAYARGLEQAVFVLTGWRVAATTGQR